MTGSHEVAGSSPASSTETKGRPIWAALRVSGGGAALRTASGDGSSAPLVDLAHAQHGVVTHAQSAARLTRKDSRERCDARRATPPYPGVFAVGHTALSREGRWLAAVFAGGEGTVLCREVVPRLLRSSAGHRACPRSLVRDGTGHRWREAVHDAQSRPSRRHRGQRDPRAPRAATVRGPQRRAHPRRAHALHPRGGPRACSIPSRPADDGARERAPQPGRARNRDRGLARRQRRIRSRGEIAFRRAVTEAGLPRPDTNRKLLGIEVDFHWPDLGS